MSLVAAHLLGGVSADEVLDRPTLDELLHRPAWHSVAACAGSDVDFFDPTQEDAAKAVCASCDALAVCRADAEADPVRYGVWGGTTRQERADARRRRRAA